MKLILDLETNGFLDKVGFKIHCIVCKDIDTNKVYSFNPDNLNDGLELLKKATLLIGHNIIKFDLPALQKHFNYTHDSIVFDTLLCSRLIWTNRLEEDFKLKNIPNHLIGKHSLESWGFRLGLLKGDYKDHDTFDEWNKSMQEYCENDVEITHLLYKKIIDEDYSKEAIELEHKFAYWINKLEQTGVFFDEDKAKTLHTFLVKKKLELEDKLALTFPAWEKVIGYKRYKRDNKKRGIKAGVPVKQVKTEIFNPSSRDHIADRLQKVLGWKPKTFTSSGKPEVTEKILKELPYPEAQDIAEYLLIQKRLGQLSDGEQAYLKLNNKGKIYGKIIENGAVTGRCSHHSPNLAQCVASHSPYGREFRSLFIAPSDMVMCGIDFSGLELRVLGHYLNTFDNGDFSQKLLEDDIHAKNQQVCGLSSRDKAKTYIYAYIYGSGVSKQSEILGVSIEEAKKIKEKFEKSLPALTTLVEAVKRKYRLKSFLKGLDGRKLLCRAEFSALNTLIQSAGALLVKQGTVILNQELHKAGLKWGTDYEMILHIHDEMQFYVRKEKVEQFKQVAKSIFKLTQQHFDFKTPLDGKIKIGSNWSETH